MNNSKIIQVLLVGISLFVGIVVISNSLTLPDYLIVSLLVSLLAFALLAIFKRNLPLDFKLLGLLLLGYAAAGKGFAYISPFEPLYIGELVLAVVLLGWGIRVVSGGGFFPTRLHWMIFGWLVTVFLYLVYGLPYYGKLALRDSAIGYYALFFVGVYAMCQSKRTSQAFPKILMGCVVFAYVGSALVSSGLYDKYIGVGPITRRYIMPHADSLIPLVNGGALYGLLQGVLLRRISYLIVGALGVLLLIFTKTAGVFCLIVVMAIFVLFARRKDVLVTSIFSAALAMVLFGVIIASGSNYVQSKIMESDQVQTLSDIGGASGFGNTSTSDWRISWWKIVFQETMKNNPWTGAGMGGDITSTFLREVMRFDLSSDQALNYARYPHNVVFTVLGRMGVIGLAVFLVVFFDISRFAIKFVSQCLKTKEGNRECLLAASVFFSGLANSLVQSTYENPYAAILNWSCLGYMAAYYWRGDWKIQIAQAEQVSIANNNPNPVDLAIKSSD
jgi:O-antigen ligase